MTLSERSGRKMDSNFKMCYNKIYIEQTPQGYTDVLNVFENFIEGEVENGRRVQE